MSSISCFGRARAGGLCCKSADLYTGHCRAPRTRVERAHTSVARTRSREVAMKRLIVGLLVLLSPSALAQQSPPEIPYDSVANLLKLPPDMHLGEVAGVAVNSKGHIYVYSRGGSSPGPAYGNTASQILEFDRNGVFLREIGKNLYAWSFAHTVRVDKDDNIWATDKGSDMVIKFSPEGRVEMVFGRKLEASDLDAHPHDREPTALHAHPPQRHPHPAAVGRRRPLPPADRRDLGSAGQHLHQRRLCEFPRRQIRQERRLGEVVGAARQRSRRIQPRAQHRRRC